MPGELRNLPLALLQEVYPERCKKIVMWAPPSLFWALWKLVKPFVDPNTAKKFVFAYALGEVGEVFPSAEAAPESMGGGLAESQLVPIEDVPP